MGLRMGEAPTALEFPEILGQIKIERWTFKPNDLTGNPALPAIFQMTYQAQAPELSWDHFRRFTHDNVSPGKIK